jgi:signal transduction histidine kinase
MEAIGRLAGGVAHDFNNLLTVIIGQSDLLALSLHGDEGSFRLVETIHRAANRAAALTRQLLAFSRKQVLQPTVLDLNAVVTGVGTLLRRVIGEDIALSIVPGPAVARVRADRSQIEQVIMNLAVNARDAMPGGGSLTIETGNARIADAAASESAGVPVGEYALLTVTDTGVGIAPEDQGVLFEEFRQVGRDATRKAEGTGLGLALTRKFVELHGGEIRVASAPGKGSTFTVSLPIR